MRFFKSIDFYVVLALIVAAIFYVAATKRLIQSQIDLGVERAQVEQLKTQVEQQRAASEYVVVTEAKAAEIREVTRTIVKEVPVYVPAEADAACVVPPGFVRVHDAAAAGVPADHPSVEPDGAASTPALSEVAATVATNYGTCNEIRQRLIGLQGYIQSFNKETK